MAIRGRRDAFGPTVKNPLAGAQPSTNKFVSVTQGSRLGKSARPRHATQILNLLKPPPPPPPPPIGVYLPIVQVANRRTSYRPRVGIQSNNPLANTTFHVFAPRLKITKGSDIYRVPIHNLSATVAPTASNDATQGYTPGSEWIDVLNQNAYVCLSNTPGAAVWKNSTNTTLTGDVTGSGDGTLATTIASHAVTYAKIQQESGATLLGNATGLAANVSEVSLGQGLTFFQGKLILSLADFETDAAITTTLTSFTDVGLDFSIKAKEVWTVEYALSVTGSAAGMLFQLTGPASPTSVLVFTHGNTTSNTAFSSDSQNAFSTPTQAYATGSFTGIVVVRATIKNGTNAGTISLQMASATGGQTNIVNAFSYSRPRFIKLLP